MIVFLLACGDRCEQDLAPETSATGDESPFDGYEPADCVPDEAAWDEHVSAIVDERCASCHGSEPSFGAPNDLTDLELLLDGEPGNRPVDRMARRAASNTMPPPTSPELSHDELDTLVGWATCGEVHPDPTIGLVADAEVYAVDVPEHAELPSFDLTSSGYAVSPDTLDRYQCFAMDIPVDEPRFVKRLQVSLDDARVLHHVVLHLDQTGSSEGLESFSCDTGDFGPTGQIWAWAPGTGAFDFEDGGLAIEPGDRAIVEIHYNNAAGLDDVVDHSGVRVFHGPVEDTEWTLAALGPEEFEVPQGDSAVCDSSEVFDARRLLAGMPHMHELGAEFQAWIERADGSRDDLVNLTGWSFEAQLVYAFDALVEEGDQVWTRCGFRNETGADAHSGNRTQDEMCFDFVFVGPP